MLSYRIKFIEQFKINQSGCWVWQRTLDKDGYGEFWIRNKKFRAHRAAWLIFMCQEPGINLVLHHCDVRNCVNPKHLYLGTPKDNMRDKMKRGRFKTGVGVRQPGAKLTDDRIKEIRFRYKHGWLQDRLSKEYKVSQSVISTIVNNRAWKHVVPQ